MKKYVTFNGKKLKKCMDCELYNLPNQLICNGKTEKEWKELENN